MQRETIVVVEDDPAILEGLALNLGLEGYRVLVARDTATGQQLIHDESVDLVLLDLMLPDGSGLDLLRTLRRNRDLDHVKVLILTALGLESDKVRGLRLGADDYITKPFGVAELLARINAALRRERSERQAPVRFGVIEIDTMQREVRLDGAAVRLTAREYDLLLFLAHHPDRVYSREQLLQQVWGSDYDGTARTVDNFVRSLRTKLEAEPSRPRHLLTVHGAGYRLAM